MTITVRTFFYLFSDRIKYRKRPYRYIIRILQYNLNRYRPLSAASVLTYSFESDSLTGIHDMMSVARYVVAVIGLNQYREYKKSNKIEILSKKKKKIKSVSNQEELTPVRLRI